MKHVTVLILLLTVLACNKEVDPSLVTPQMLNGKWEIRKQLGGFIGIQDFPPGNGHILEFTTSKLTFIDKGTATQTAIYVLHREPSNSTDCPSMLPYKEMERLLTDPDIGYNSREFILIKDGKLTMLTTCGIPDQPYYTEWEKIE
jgi:hypothetical protein